MEQGIDSLKQSKIPIEFIQTLDGGTAHVILFSDGNKYVVKWNGTRKKRAREVVNEYVVGKLAELLSLPVVPFELVNIPKEFIKKTPELKSKKYKFSSGYHFCCLFFENSNVFDDVSENPPSKGEVKNRVMLAGMTVFDQWVHNFDRTMSNLLLEHLSEGGFYVRMIDHGRCFPGEYTWSSQTLSVIREYKPDYQEAYQWVFSLLDDQKDLLAFVETIITLPNQSIYEVIQSIPKEWQVSVEDREALYQFLLEQKNHLPNVIAGMIDYYTQKKKKLLLTGANGKIGRRLHIELEKRGTYDILGVDIEPDQDSNVVQLDVTEAARLEALIVGVHTVLHFAWAKDEEDFLGKVLPLNVTGAYHLYEAARKNGVKRIIFASSNHVTGFYRVGEQVKPEDPYQPDSFYGLSKCYIELLGRYYADKYGISSINIRIGNFSGDDRPLSERASRIWISCRDMVQLTVCCIEAEPSISFLSLYGTSANTSNYYDIGYLEDLIGYKPEDNAAALMEEEIRLGKLPQNNIPFQGGRHAITSRAEDGRK